MNETTLIVYFFINLLFLFWMLSNEDLRDGWYFRDGVQLKHLLMLILFFPATLAYAMVMGFVFLVILFGFTALSSYDYLREKKVLRRFRGVLNKKLFDLPERLHRYK